ncbi:MAG: copper amine oxidase N-terminal domain-containing protein [Clostridium sp.]|nr:copper amine oxidase N-terminal domain-containing protein [Clostridium sp.]
MQRRKILFSYALVFCFLFTLNFLTDISFATKTSPDTKNNIKVRLNGEELEFDEEPYIKNGRTMVPFRKIFESLDVEVSWDEINRTVLASNETTRIFTGIGNDYAHVNGFRIALDAPSEIVGGRTFVPLRFVSENAGAEVSWDSNTRTVYINYVDNKYMIGDVVYYKDIEFTVNGIEEHKNEGLITVTGWSNLPDRHLIIEVYNETGRLSRGIAEISPQKGELYPYKADIYAKSPFEPKFIIIKTLNNLKSQVKIAQFDL